MPIGQFALVILTTMEGRNLQQTTAHEGCAQFSGVPGGSYNLQVIASGYERAIERLNVGADSKSGVTVTLKPASDGQATAAPPKPTILSSKAKKELGKGLEAMRAGKLAEARVHLDAAYALAPESFEVNYVLGIYSIETNESARAKDYLEKVLNLDPQHVGALRSIGIVLLGENKPADAIPYLRAALEAEPASWYGHALLADAALRLGSIDESVAQAERAVELDREHAEIVQPLFAWALAERGDKEKAIHILQSYLQNHASDIAAKSRLEKLQIIPQVDTERKAPAATLEATSATPAVAVPYSLLLPSNWLPPDVDEKVPPIEPGATCALDEVLKNSGERVQEFVTNVDRFTATESITHETISKWGLASPPEEFKFDYLVSIGEPEPGFLSVEEFRPRAYSPSQFPDGLVRRGLPAMLLIFHPHTADKFEMTCEGLAHWKGKLVWLVHFRQRVDKPNVVYSYRLGETGMSYPVALKGRAWIAAEDYQIVRLEADLVAPLPQIRLVADHACVEYGPVNFRTRNVDMWLPQTAEFYYEWRGHRGHRIHRFTNYMLFSVDDKQHISAPKAESRSSTDNPGDPAKPDL